MLQPSANTFPSVSIMVVQLVAEGILFATDRNITTTLSGADTTMIGQSQRPKVLKWPNREVIVGFVGLGKLEDKPTDLWLYDFIGAHLDESESLCELALALEDRLEFAFRNEDPDDVPELIIHLGAFVERDGEWVPEVWFIRNPHAMNEAGEYTDVSLDFDATEELATPARFAGMSGNEIRERVRAMADRNQPFWFHQGYDLGTFNILEGAARAGLSAIIDHHKHAWRLHRKPTTIEEWARHVRMSVLVYGAYFGAFYEPYEQYVGGGADVVWAEWPAVDPIA
jgi:hypothetical protein